MNVSLYFGMEGESGHIWLRIMSRSISLSRKCFSEFPVLLLQQTQRLVLSRAPVIKKKIMENRSACRTAEIDFSVPAETVRQIRDGLRMVKNGAVMVPKISKP